MRRQFRRWRLRLRREHLEGGKQEKTTRKMLDSLMAAPFLSEVLFPLVTCICLPRELLLSPYRWTGMSMSRIS